jgi:hypothetical protein
MHKMRFARNESPRRQRHGRIRQHDPGHGARSFRLASIALGQAFQFECTLRQKDVIGEWCPLSEPGVSAVIIAAEMASRHRLAGDRRQPDPAARHQQEAEDDRGRSKAGADGDGGIAAHGRRRAADRGGRDHQEGHGQPSPAAGVRPGRHLRHHGLPWTGNEYRRKWRWSRGKCGIPDNVWNMDSRSGAISEAIQAGAPIEFVRHAATHSDVSQTADYDRGQAEATAKVMKLRMESRNKPKTE